MKIKFVQKIIDKIRGKKELDSRWIDAEDKFPVRMTELERAFFVEHIKNAKHYLEFGSGGSTFLTLKKTQIQKIVSVESDNAWLDYLRSWDLIKDNENKRLIFTHVNIGKTGDWGFPIEHDKKELFPKYSSYPFENNEKYDVIFIDGRFRVACTLQAILNSDIDTKILMHDFNNRPQYHCILKFLEIVDTADTMALFKIKQNFDKNNIIEMYKKYMFDYN